MLRYLVSFPDGTSASKLTPDWVIHKFAVIGLFKIRRLLPPLDPKNKDEEPRYRRYTRWVILSTTETEARALRKLADPTCPEATLESRVVPIVGVPYTNPKPGVAEDEGHGPFVPPTAPPEFKVRNFAIKGIETTQADGLLTTRLTVEVALTEITLSPEQVAQLTHRSGLVDSLKQTTLEASTYILPLTEPDGVTHLVELQGVTIQSMSYTVDELVPDESDVVDFDDL